MKCPSSLIPHTSEQIEPASRGYIPNMQGVPVENMTAQELLTSGAHGFLTNFHCPKGAQYVWNSCPGYTTLGNIGLEISMPTWEDDLMCACPSRRDNHYLGQDCPCLYNV